MINPIIISRLIEAGYGVYLPVDGDSRIVVTLPIEDGSIDDYQIIWCTTASQDKDHSPIVKCPLRAMITAVVDVVVGCVWVIPADLVEGRKNLRLGRDMEEFIIPQPISPSFREAQEKRKRRLKALEEDTRKAIERIKGGKDVRNEH